MKKQGCAQSGMSARGPTQWLNHSQIACLSNTKKESVTSLRTLMSVCRLDGRSFCHAFLNVGERLHFHALASDDLFCLLGRAPLGVMSQLFIFSVLLCSLDLV